MAISIACLTVMLIIYYLNVSKSDVSDQENITTRSIRCNSPKGNGAYNTTVKKEVMSIHFDGDIYTAGHVIHCHPVELKPKNEYDFVQADVKQLIQRIQLLEEEMDSMGQAVQYLKRQNSCLTQLNKIAPEGYEGQTPDKSDNVTRRLPPPEGSSFFSTIRWILSYILRINVWRSQSRTRISSGPRPLRQKNSIYRRSCTAGTVKACFAGFLRMPGDQGCRLQNASF